MPYSDFFLSFISKNDFIRNSELYSESPAKDSRHGGGLNSTLYYHFYYYNLVSFSALVSFLVIVVSVFMEVSRMSVRKIVHACLITFGSVRNGDYYYREQNETKRFVSRHFKDFTVPFRFLN